MLEELSVIFRWLSLGLLIVATVLYAYQFTMQKKNLFRWARVITGAGLLLLTAAIGTRPFAFDGTQLTGSHSTLVLLAWALLVLYFAVEHFLKIKIYGVALVPVVVLLLLVAQFQSGAAGEGLATREYALVDSWRVGIHVAMILAANALFAVGGLAAVFYLLQDAQLKAHKTSTLFRRLPSLSQAQALARRAIALAYPIYTAGIFLGIVRAIETGVEGWYSDPRIIMSGFVWMIYGVYLLRVYRHGISARSASWIAVLGIVAVVSISVLARTLPVGFHLFAL